MTNKKHYPETTNFLDINSIEKFILNYWQENNTFQKSIDNNNGQEEYVFYDGPPFANGLPHYGHLLTGFIKDAFARYHTMQGKKVERRFGWDCHGLPAEMSAEKELGISGRRNIKEFGVDKFNAKCSDLVMKYSKEWKEYVTKQARWVDFDNGYKTMDKSFMESVIWAFKQLYDKGLVYRDVRIMPYSWACETPLSNFETKLDNSYRQKTSKTVTIKFKLQNHSLIDGDIYCLVWTTTPWTLPANLALAVGNAVEYAIVKHKDENLICSKSYAVKNKHEIIKDINANDLIGITYQSLFDYFKNHKGAFTVMSADFVVDGEGTGIVHIAPGFGEDDFHLCKANNIEYVCPVNESGCYTDEIYDLKDMNVLQANDEVIKKLKNNGNWFATEQYIHNYPHCWRTDEPLIYKAVSSWYIRVTDLKDRMIELNKTVNWYPDHVKEGQFGKWLENVRDWSVSRERFWGTPLPIWESDNPKYPRIDVYGSIEELERDFNVKVNDLHSHHLDKLVRNNPDDPTGKSKMCRIGGVFDCWFESGSMPFAQMHYPFENKEKFEKNSPADFITEYIAQTRGWFYTMFVLSVALFDRIPFKNCVCHGVVLDVKGQKLSKRLNNYEDPLELFNKYGSDSLRFLMLSSSVVGGGNLLIDKECIAVKDIFRTVLMPIWNAYHFFCMYANADKIGELELITLSDLNNNQDAMNYEIDSWILIKIDLLFHQNSLSNYNTQDICKSIINFIDDLNNWYIRCNRERFWQTEITNNKIIAYRILYTVLCYFAITIAPLLPIISEYIWQGLNFKSVYNIESVHLAIFDKKLYIEDEKKIYLRPDHYGRRFSPLQSIKQMDFVKNICNTTLAIRDKLNIRIRQPLNSIMIYVKYGNDVVIEQLKDNSSPYSILLKEQTNVKNIKIKDDLFYTIATKKIKINFKNLSRDILKHTKKIMDAVKNNQYEETENELHIDIGSGEIFVLTLGEYTAIWEPKDENTMIYDNRIAVQLDTEITEELKLEGISRDIVRHIQQKRKDKGLYVMDRIEINLYSDDKVYKDVLDVHIDYIKHVTLADEIIFTDKKINDYDDIYDDNLYIKLTIV